jgi:hypothetical protein
VTYILREGKRYYFKPGVANTTLLSNKMQVLKE